MKELIDFNTFLEIEKKLSIKIGQIMEVERMPKSKKMLKLKVEFGDHERTVMTNIGDKVEPEALLHSRLPFIMNLKPASIMGIESSAMIVVGTTDDGDVRLNFNQPGLTLM